MELPKKLKNKYEAKLPPCPVCGGRLAYRVSIGDNTMAGIILCSAKSACSYKTYPLRIFLKQVKEKTPEEEKKREDAAFNTMFYSLAREFDTSWHLKREKQKEEESNVGRIEESIQENPRRSRRKSFNDEEPDADRAFD